MRGIRGEGGREGVNESRWRPGVKTFFVVGVVFVGFCCVCVGSPNLEVRGWRTPVSTLGELLPPPYTHTPKKEL